MTRTALDVLADREGSVEMGFVGPSVFYARFTGGLSGHVGVAFAAHLQAVVERASSLRYYADASSLTYYDLLARSAFVRVVLANRRTFTALVLLTWAEGISVAGKAFAAILGDPVDLMTNAADFETRLLRDAPLAKYKLRRDSFAPRSGAG